MGNSQNSNNTESNRNSQIKDETVSKPKPPKPEDKPFELFISEELIPGLTEVLTKLGFPPIQIMLEKGSRPVSGGDCWMVIGEISNNRQFWLCFESNLISSKKTLALSEHGFPPSVLESFLIDEKKTTKALLISRLIQRLNGQKWLGAN